MLPYGTQCIAQAKVCRRWIFLSPMWIGRGGVYKNGFEDCRLKCNRPLATDYLLISQTPENFFQAAPGGLQAVNIQFLFGGEQ